MTETETRAKLLQIVKQFAREDREPVETEMLFDTGLLDSFALPEVVGAIEEAFGIRIPDADLNPRQFASLARMEAYLRRGLH
jgi:acyl carrier protein